MKFRKHHNNKGLRQIKNGKLKKQMKLLANKMKISYGNLKKDLPVCTCAYSDPVGDAYCKFHRG